MLEAVAGDTLVFRGAERDVSTTSSPVKKLLTCFWTGIGLAVAAAMVLTGMGWLVTIVVGVLVAVIGLICLEPVRELRKAVSETVEALSFYSSNYSSKKARDLLYQKQSELGARAQDVRLYPLFSSLGVIPDLESIEKVCKKLRAISNEPDGLPDSAAVVKGKVNEILIALKRRIF